MIVNGNPCYVRSEDVGRALCGLILTTLIFVAARSYRMQTEHTVATVLKQCSSDETKALLVLLMFLLSLLRNLALPSIRRATA